MTTLLVASIGGHLSELHRLASRLEPIDDHRVWVTSAHPQSESLLAGEEVVFVPPVRVRDVAGLLRCLPAVRRLLVHYDATSVVSTGSGLALAVLPLAAARGSSCHYIESATRVDDVSLTGSLLQRVPGVRLYHQFEATARGPWRFAGSIYDGFAAGKPPTPAAEIRRLVVTVGTMVDYGFRRLIAKLAALVPPAVDVLWQTGSTPVDDLDIEARPIVPARELGAAMAAADVVIAHCGVGSSIDCLEAGRFPVLVPRESAHDEHVDDHHLTLARFLAARGLAFTPTVDELGWEHVERASTRRIVRTELASPFRLAP